jgi:ABC-type transporter Mla MlaB component
MASAVPLQSLEGWKFMWKVQKMAEGELVLLNLGGRLEGRELTELQSVIASESEDRKIALDLRDLKLVDQETVTFLARCETGGAQLRNCPAYIREWINRERIGK